VSHRSSDLVGAGLVILAAACFGTLGPLSEFASRAGVTSLALVTWRGALGASCMVLFVAWQSTSARRLPQRLGALPLRDRWAMAGASLANAILNLAVFVAFLRIGIAMTLLIFYLYPAFVALTSVLWFGERLDRLRWSALVISLVGMVLVVAGANAPGTLDALGIGLSLLGAVSQTFYVLAARHGFARVPGAQAAGLTMAGAASIYLLVALATGSLGALTQPLDSAAAFWPVLLAGVVGAGVPTLAFITGIRLLGAPRAAILATFEPVVGVALAALLLGQQPAPVQLVGGVMIISAGVVLQLRPREGAVAEHEAVVDASEAAS
jgi:drug/metabolite transporter, DME family